jgi:hypothetical protein
MHGLQRLEGIVVAARGVQAAARWDGYSGSVVRSALSFLYQTRSYQDLASERNPQAQGRSL